MYGDWQLGHMPLEGLREEAQRPSPRRCGRRSPDLELIGVGAVGPWTEAMLAECAGHMSLLSEHFYSQEKPGLMSHVAQIPRRVRAHRRGAPAVPSRRFPSLKGKDIRIALDEWNYWYGPHVYGELGTQYFLKDALGIAAGLHEYARQSDIIFMANYAQTVNVIGAIKTSKTDAVLDTTGLVLRCTAGTSGRFPSKRRARPNRWTSPRRGRDGRKSLTIAIVNPTAVEQGVDLDVAGLAVPASAHLWRIAGHGREGVQRAGQAAAGGDPGDAGRAFRPADHRAAAERLDLRDQVGKERHVRRRRLREAPAGRFSSNSSTACCCSSATPIRR